MPTYTLILDAASEALSTSLIPAVQAAYDAGPGYPPATIDQAYVLSSAIRVGLHYWIPPRLWGAYQIDGAQPNIPSVPKLTPGVLGTAALVVDVGAADIALANEIIAALGVSWPTAVVDTLGCGLCTGLAALSGTSAQVGPFIHP